MRTFLLLVCALFGRLSPSVTAMLYQDKPDVHTLNDYGQMESTVLQSEGLWLVQFCIHDHVECEKVIRDYANMASLMKGVFHLGFVDVETDEGAFIAKKLQVDTSQVPALYWFLDDKMAPQKMVGSTSLEYMTGLAMKTMAETISARAQNLGLGINVSSEGEEEKKREQTQQKSDSSRKNRKQKKGPSKVVQVKGDDEFENKVILDPLVTMVAFTAPWCGHCKMLEPEWQEAAEKLDGHGAQLVWIDATDGANQQLAHTFGVKGYPTIVTFPGGAPKVMGAALPYQGERKARDIVQYVLAEVDRTGVPKEIPELTSLDILKEECKGQNHICVVAALPHILDTGASGRNQYRDLLAKVAKTFRGTAFSFLWFQGGDQPAFESAMELTFGYPALIAYSMDRNAFAVMHGSFTERGMTSFLHGVTSGRVPVAKLAKEEVPKIESTEPWDGLDAAPPEEEFDLADIMGWDDDEGGEKKEEKPGEGSNEEL